jgi:hypothetical protein
MYVFFSITLNCNNGIKFILHVCEKLKRTDITRPGVWDIQLFHQTTAGKTDEKNPINASWKEFIVKDSTWNYCIRELKKRQTTIIGGLQ